MKQLFEILRNVAARPYHDFHGRRADLLVSAVEGKDAFTYDIPGMSENVVGFSAHLDTVFGDECVLQELPGKFRGTLDNAVGVALLIQLRNDVMHGRFIPRNSVKLIFTKQEEPHFGFPPYYSAEHLVQYLDGVNLMAVVDVRYKKDSKKRVIIENCDPNTETLSVTDFAELVAGEIAEVRPTLAPDEAIAYSKRFPVLSVGPGIVTDDCHKLIPVSKRAITDTYKVIKRIADTKLP